MMAIDLKKKMVADWRKRKKCVELETKIVV